jgi:hypothetical protein
LAIPGDSLVRVTSCGSSFCLCIQENCWRVRGNTEEIIGQ